MEYDRIKFENAGFPICIHADYTAHARLNIDGNREKWHEQLEILRILEGECYVSIYGKSFSCRPGDIVIINPFELHLVYIGREKPIYNCIMIDSKLYSGEEDITGEKYTRPLTMRKLLFENLIRDDCELVEALDDMVNEYKTKIPAYELAIKSSIYKVLTKLNRYYVKAEMSPREHEKQLKRLDAVGNAIELLSASLEQLPQLSEIAETVGMSEYHFSRVFKRFTGKTVFEYIEKVKMEKAIYLLTETKKNISEIADECGYSNTSYFSKCFRTFYSVTPSEYRRKYGKTKQ